MTSTINGRRLTLKNWKRIGVFVFLWGLSTYHLWTTNPLTHYAPITTRIPRWRFREISRYLHFVNNQHLAPRGSPTFDRLGKVRPVIDHFSLQFSALYNPSKNLAVDEAMIKFQGRSALKQYMPMKPIKRGIKVWVLGDSTNGYFSRFDVYTGKQEIRHVGLGEHVVKKLTSELKRKNHHVYFDNFFTNVKLLEDLLEDGIYGCGTARRDRKGFPPALKKAALKNSLKQRYKIITHTHPRNTHTHTHPYTHTPTQHTHPRNTQTHTHTLIHTPTPTQHSYTHTHPHTHTHATCTLTQPLIMLRYLYTEVPVRQSRRAP